MPGALQFLRLRQGRLGLVPTPDETASYPYSDEDGPSSRSGWPGR
jgi:hypothetical protein